MAVTSVARYSPLALYRTTVGKKVVMAGSGLMLLGYVVVHMLGNLKVFTGESHFDEYAEFLRRIGIPLLGHSWFLWGMRMLLLVAVIAHIISAVQLTRLSREARPIRYARTATVDASYAAKTMRWGGLTIALFVIYHILHLTTGTAHPAFVHGKPYGNIVAGFQVWYVSAFYCLAMLALGAHLHHGIWSTFQTLGVRPAKERLIRRAAMTTAAVVTLGFVSVPAAVMTGILA
ncbi:MAG: succinate dehydrogenase cytochrome b subunit [Acidimicrobiia bacterium]